MPFSFFKNFDFLGCLGVKSQNNSPKWQTVCRSVALRIPGTVPIFGTHVYKRGGMGKRGKMTHNYQFQYATLYISGIIDHIMKIFGTQVNTSSSSINAKQKFWGNLHLLHICDFFNIVCFRVGKAILYLKIVISVNILKIKISNKYIFFTLNFPLLTFNFQTYKSMANKKTN